jgi:3-methyladenine DNA glycosylase AlkD
MIDEQALIEDLQRRLDAVASEAKREWWERYLKRSIRFRGVGIPEIRGVLARWRSEAGIDEWPATGQFDLALRLFEERHAEDKLAGVLFLQEHVHDRVGWRDALTGYAGLYERGLIHDWNTSDWFCVRVLGPTLASNGVRCAAALASWSEAPDLWQARSSVVGFVKVVGQARYHEMVLRSAASVIRRDERFAKTGVGWVLREMSRHHSERVVAFVDDNLLHFSVESLRNALQYSPREQTDALVERLRAR